MKKIKMLNYTIIPMHSAHLAGVTAIEAASFSSPWSRESFEEILANPYSVYFTALDAEGCVAGYAGMYLMPDGGEIHNVATAPERRRQGIASLLLSALIEIAGRKNAPQLTLEVRVSNAPARALYRRFGFADIGIRRGYYTHPSEDAVVMLRKNGY